MLSSSRGQGNFRGLEALRPRTSKFVLEDVLEAKDVLEDSTSEYNVPQQFVEMLLLQNKPNLVRYKKIRAMSFLPSVECGKFNLKKAIKSGKILACTKKSKNCATFTLKLIKMMLKYQVA